MYLLFWKGANVHHNTVTDILTVAFILYMKGYIIHYYTRITSGVYY